MNICEVLPALACDRNELRPRLARIGNLRERATAANGRARLAQRSTRLQERRIDFIDNESFRNPLAESEILGPAPERSSSKNATVVRPPADLEPYLASLYEVPLLSREEEAYYFRKMNYLKFCASQLRDGLGDRRANAKEIRQIESLLNQADDVKRFLIRSNLRLVVSLAKRFVKSGTDLFELVSDGNVSLMRAIEKFDYARGFKFSTYATWAIVKDFYRSIPAEHARLERFRTGCDELIDDSLVDARTNPFVLERTNRRQHAALNTLLCRLDPRDLEVVSFRFGLKPGTEPLTLEEIGRRFGVSKERVRQLEKRALTKLRKMASEDGVDVFEE